MTRGELQKAVDLHLGPAPEAGVVRHAAQVLADIIPGDVDGLGRIPPDWRGDDDVEAAQLLADFDRPDRPR